MYMRRRNKPIILYIILYPSDFFNIKRKNSLIRNLAKSP